MKGLNLETPTRETDAAVEKVLGYKMDNIEEKIKKIMAKSFLVKMEVLTDDADLLNDVKADSLGVFEMIINLEDEFGVEFKDRELLTFKTVGEAVQVLAGLIRGMKA